MEPVEIKTPSGYQVSIKPRLNYGQSVELKQTILAKTQMNVKDKSLKDLPGDVLIETNKVALKFLVVKVINPDGTIAPDPVAAVYDMPVEDGEAVADKVDEITAQTDLSKKK